MRPRRTFESVVSELIEGLNSGEIVLKEDQVRVPRSHLLGLPTRLPIHSPSYVAPLQLALMFDHAFRDNKKSAIGADIEVTVANARRRVWILGDVDSETRNLIKQFRNQATHPHQELKILMSAPDGPDLPRERQSEDIKALIRQLREYGLTDNVRFLDARLGVLCAFADDTVYAKMRRDKTILQPVRSAKWLRSLHGPTLLLWPLIIELCISWFWSTLQRWSNRKDRYGHRDEWGGQVQQLVEAILINERTDPTRFRRLERIYDWLWNTG